MAGSIQGSLVGSEQGSYNGSIQDVNELMPTMHINLFDPSQTGAGEVGHASGPQLGIPGKARNSTVSSLGKGGAMRPSARISQLPSLAPPVFAVTRPSGTVQM